MGCRVWGFAASATAVCAAAVKNHITLPVKKAAVVNPHTHLAALFLVVCVQQLVGFVAVGFIKVLVVHGLCAFGGGGGGGSWAAAHVTCGLLESLWLWGSSKYCWVHGMCVYWGRVEGGWKG